MHRLLWWSKLITCFSDYLDSFEKKLFFLSYHDSWSIVVLLNKKNFVMSIINSLYTRLHSIIDFLFQNFLLCSIISYVFHNSRYVPGFPIIAKITSYVPQFLISFHDFPICSRISYFVPGLPFLFHTFLVYSIISYFVPL